MRLPCIRQPWAWLITRPDITNPVVRAALVRRAVIKNIENRSWATKFRGPVLIHASKTMTAKQYGQTADFVEGSGIKLPPASQLDRGGIVGYAEITDCVSASTSPWFMGEYGFVLENQIALSFSPCKGSLSFFSVDVPDDYLAAAPSFTVPA